MLIGREKLIATAKEALGFCKTEQAEILLMTEKSYLTRFANNYIHQNVAENNVFIGVRAVDKQRIGCASTNHLDTASLKAAVADAQEICYLQKPDPVFKSLPAPPNGKNAPEFKNTFCETTANYQAKHRAQSAQIIIKQAKDKGFLAFGAYTTGVVEVVVVNSLGIEVYNSFTDANLTTIVMGFDGNSGYSSGVSKDINLINAELIAKEAVDKCFRTKNAVNIKPGLYPVILQHYAVADLMLFLGWLSLNAMAVQESRSFLCGKIGQQVLGDNITIYDDASVSESFNTPFDFEGVPKSKVMMIENGVAKAVVYDSYTAGKENKTSTGHALPAPNPSGPAPFNTILATGDSSLEKMIASTDQGIFVTRFHYVNVLEPMALTLTGMTRDGTFLIEKGEITKPIKNFRFTQSVVKALNKVSAISSTRKLASEGTVYARRFATGALVPSIKIDEFHFTGSISQG